MFLTSSLLMVLIHCCWNFQEVLNYKQNFEILLPNVLYSKIPNMLERAESPLGFN